MKNWKHCTAFGFFAIITLIFAFMACDNSGNNDPKTFTVTFDADNGTENTTKAVNEGSTVSIPTTPIKANDVAGLYQGTPPNYTFVEWRKPDSTAWNFAIDTVIADIILTAIWITPVPITNVIVNDITAAVNYININPDTYTLLINQNVNADNQNLNVGNVNLTIIGIGEERVIQYNGAINQRLIDINSNNASLILGNNITLKGIGNSTINLVRVDAGSLTMKNGSKITGHTTTTVFGIVRFQGENSHFIMEGGEIIGNISTATSDNATGGVRVQSGASFFMSGGTITGNFGNTNIPSDVLILNENADYPEYPQTSFIQTGGTIGVIRNDLIP